MYDTQKWLHIQTYTDIHKQLWRQKNRLGNYKSGIRLVPRDRIPPLICNRLLTIDSVQSVKLARPNNFNNPEDITYTTQVTSSCAEIDLIGKIRSGDLIYRTDRNGIDSIIFLGKQTLDDGVGGNYDLPLGIYFFELKDSNYTWYSELFKIVNYSYDNTTGIGVNDGVDTPGSLGFLDLS